MERVKNTVAFVAMLMIVAMNIAPLAVKAGQVSYPWGFGFDFSDEVDYTDIETKNTSSSVRMTCDMADTDGSYRASVFAANSDDNIYQKIQHMICLIGLMKMVIIELALKLYVTIVMMSMEQILQDIGILIFTN